MAPFTSFRVTRSTQPHLAPCHLGFSLRSISSGAT